MCQALLVGRIQIQSHVMSCVVQSVVQLQYSQLNDALNTQYSVGPSGLVGPRGSAVERQSLASVLSPSCAGPVTNG